MMKTKSYFPRIFRDFLITLLVPILSMALLYLQAGNSIREQILISNKNTLNQFFELIDTTFSEMEWTGYTITNRRECQEYASYAATGNRNLSSMVPRIVQFLNEAINEKYYDLFIYYPGNGRIMSGRFGSVDCEWYAASFYSGEKRIGQFFEILECDTKDVSLYVMEQEGEEPLLCLAMRKKIVGNHKNDYVIVQVLEPQYLNRIMSDIYESDEGVLQIYDEEKNLLISGDGNREYHLEGYEEKEVPYEVKIGNSTYMMQVQPAKSADGYYAVAVDATVFWDKLTNLRLLCIVGGFACIVISVFAAWRGSKRAYLPLGSIIHQIEANKLLQYDSKEHSEVEFINQIFESEAKQWHLFYKKKQEEGVSEFIAALLYGNVNTESGEDAFTKNGIPLCSDNFCVAVLICENSVQMGSDLQAFAMKNIFEELFNRKDRGYLVRTAENQYVLLINLGENGEITRLSEIMQEGQCFLKEHLGTLVSAAMGDVHEGMAEIPCSYKEAKMAMRYKYIFGEECCILYKQIRGREFNYSASVESKLSKMIIGYVKDTASSKTPQQFTKELLEIYGINEQASLDTVECFKYEILSVINKAVVSNKGVFISYKERIEEMLTQPTLEKFEKKLTQILTELKEKEKEMAATEDICNKVRSYISAHYAEADLTVNLLAEKMKVSAYYLSKLFKDKYDISIPDYISQTRIRSAKEELKNTSKTIKQIAEENGFLSSNVFINTFKKWEGITPGIYRKLL